MTVGSALVMLLLLGACGGNSDAPVGDAAATIPAEACTGGVDEDQDTFIDCDDDDCWTDAACYQVDDDTDLPEPLGDPSVDIDKIRATLVAGTATFFATFDGAWPPPATAYSWYLYFEIDNDGNTPQAAVTVQHQAGIDSIVPLPGFSAANVTVRQTPRGVWARLINVPAVGQRYYIESGIQEANPGTRVTDTVVGAPAPLP